MAAAHDWGLKPSVFWAASEDDQAFMTAYTKTRGNMTAWERQLQDDEIERQRSRHA